MTMTVEEFQESDVIFSDNEYDSSCSCGSNEFNFNSRGQMSESRHRNKKQRKKQRSVSASVPIHIPSNMSVRSSTDSDEEEEDQLLPPHLIVARRIEERMMAFSVQAGYGRPALKGRELRQVRNSILRMTGFLET